VPLADGDGCGIDAEPEDEDEDEDDEEDEDIELDSEDTTEEAVTIVEDMANPDDTAEVAVAPVAKDGAVAESKAVDESAEGLGNPGPVAKVGTEPSELISWEVAPESTESVVSTVEVVGAVDPAIGRLASVVGVGSSAGLVDPPYTHPVPRGIEGP
jgi:hypothetical protein